MNELTRLQANELTESEATEVLLAWARRHTDMLNNLLRIKASVPQADGQESFRRQRPDSVSLEQLQLILQDFVNELIAISQAQEKSHILQLEAMQRTGKKLTDVYAGKSTAFAVILNELNALENAILQKMPKNSDYEEVITEGDKKEEQKATVSYVYIRVFHRQLSQLLLPEADKSWLKTVLESVRESEKHGLAVYADETDVKRSLRGENYGYVTVAITADQDITHLRRVKQDPQLLCPILTIAPITLSQLKKLTYAEIDYIIENGLIRRV